MSETKLRLDANEGLPAISAAALAARIGPDTLRRYPDARPLEEALARRLGLGASRVLAAAGADDAIDRAVRSLAGPGGTVVSAEPSFDEYAAAAARSGARYEARPREPGSPFPLEAILEALSAERAAGRRALAIVASPDNPGGAATEESDIAALAAAGFPVLLDLTYGAFASRGACAGLAFAAPLSDGVLAIGSLSKAFGLAGLRIGWACGPEELVAALRRAGPPYSLSSVAIVAGLAALEADEAALAAFVAEVRRERSLLEAALASMGARTWAGEANFAAAFVGDAAGLSGALATEGVLVRTWPGRPGRENLVRITCPGESEEFLRLLDALEASSASVRADASKAGLMATGGRA